MVREKLIEYGRLRINIKIKDLWVIGKYYEEKLIFES